MSHDVILEYDDAFDFFTIQRLLGKFLRWLKLNCLGEEFPLNLEMKNVLIAYPYQLNCCFKLWEKFSEDDTHACDKRVENKILTRDEHFSKNLNGFIFLMINE